MINSVTWLEGHGRGNDSIHALINCASIRIAVGPYAEGWDCSIACYYRALRARSQVLLLIVALYTLFGIE